jgi:hypothetical protein
VENDRLFSASTLAEVICLDIVVRRMSDSQAKEIWKLGLMDLGVWPRAGVMGGLAHGLYPMSLKSPTGRL